MSNLQVTESDGGLPANAVAPPEEAVEAVVEDTVEQVEEKPEESAEDGPEKVEGKSEEKEDKAGKRFTKRIKHLTWQAREAERKAQEMEQKVKDLEAKQAIKEKPSEDDYIDPDKYAESMRQWEAQERERIRMEERQAILEEDKRRKQEQTMQEKMMSYAEKREDAKKSFENYEESEKLVDAIVNASGSEAIRQTVLGSDIGPAIVDYLGNNPDELEEIADKSQLEQARVLGRIEAKLEAKPVKKVSTAPAPTRSSNGSATGKIGSGGGKYGGYGSWKEFCKARNGK